jgi:hypothetical protein
MTTNEENLTFRISDAQPIALCPGKPRACAGLPNRDTEWSLRGTAKHLALSSYFTEGLDSEKYIEAYAALENDDQDTVDLLIGKTESLIDQYGGITPGCSPACEIEVTVSGWTGHPDFAAPMGPDGARILLIDWKSGFADVPDPDENAQLRGYVCAIPPIAEAAGWPEFVDVVATIVSPLASPDPVQYEAGDILTGSVELTQIRETAENPYAPRIPSPVACQYCPAVGTARCPESRSMALELWSASPMIDWQEADPLFLVSIMRAGKVVEKILKAAKAEVDRRTQEDPDSVPGARRVLGNERRLIQDHALLFEQLMKGGISEKDLWESGALKFTLGKVEKLLPKGKAAPYLEGNIKTVRNKDSIEV